MTRSRKYYQVFRVSGAFLDLFRKNVHERKEPKIFTMCTFKAATRDSLTPL